MAQEHINTGGSAGDKTGTNWRAAFEMIERMFTEIYGKLFASGKVLSDNNYSNEEKTKLANLSKTDIGLGNVDNTSDINKPVSTATQTAINTAVNALINGAPGALDTLKELADAMADDAAFSATVTNALALKQAITDNTLATTAKTIVGAINEHQTKIAFDETVTVDYTYTIPLNKGETIITGKTLTTNDTFGVAANPVNGASARLELIGNGSAIPVYTGWSKTGDYDATTGVKNIHLFYRLGDVNYVMITQSAVV